MPQEQPVALLAAGPPGSGRTSVADLLHAVLNRRGGAVRTGSDLYEDVPPAYRALRGRDVRAAGAGVRADVRWWRAGVEEYVRAHHSDVLMETRARRSGHGRSPTRNAAVVSLLPCPHPKRSVEFRRVQPRR
ncbi:zeta toxin family protein [Kitasatospora phosalacinea]|uniref:UDP-N-acetylglucosamine kinase n=1 Tax=Kitasatospora phosalacinea TaxID=2065 RepID=A0A9W6PCV5_9ACTN|nr:zeta toxin family protein [Kitasatospora phosalacinea]GLW53510.1 hypothetical protein Kpho01_15210 [Kitasatospora phosalacinea]